MALEFAGRALRLTDAEIVQVGQSVNLDPALIHTVMEVEAGSLGGFLPDGRPTILYEAHKFGAYTKGKYNASHPSISAPRWNKALYLGKEREYDRLALALTLDRAAALKSCSWGLFQIMGGNHAMLGYADVESFVRDNMESERNHLLMFLGFLSKSNIMGALKAHDFLTVARVYNGLGQVEYYAGKLASAYAKWSARCGSCAPVKAVVAAPQVVPVAGLMRAKQDVNIRTGPGPNHLMTRQSPLLKGDDVAVVGQTPGWTQIRNDDGSGGWVATSFLVPT